MPFLNDLLEQTRRDASSKAVMDAENCYTQNIVEAHLRSDPSCESRFRFDIPSVMAVLREEILGQDEALQAVEDVLTVVRADILDPRRPLYTALFLGATGVGKTEVVRALARALHGDAEAYCRVDMNTLSQEHYAAALAGAPPGYAGAKEGYSLFDQSKLDGAAGRPGILLLDEVEKASKDVTQTLLNIFDNGLLKLTSGEKTFNFRNTLIFMTTNLAAKEIRGSRSGVTPLLRNLLSSRSTSSTRLYKVVRHRLVKRFSPEFVNRIDNTIIFNSIQRGVAEKIVSLEVLKLNRRLMKHRCCVRLNSNVITKIASEGYDNEFGVRALKRYLRHCLEVPLADFLLEEKLSCRPMGELVTIVGDLNRGRLVFSHKI